MNEAIEQYFPVAIAGEVVIGDDETMDVLRVIFAYDLFDVVGRAANGSCDLAR
jgi:hypothetical protein